MTVLLVYILRSYEVFLFKLYLLVRDTYGVFIVLCVAKNSIIKSTRYLSYVNDQYCSYGSILLADGRSLKDMCKELADQSKLGNRAIQVPRNGNVKPCPGCGKQGDLESCQGCKSAWCPNCAKQFSGLGQKIPCKISQLFEKLLAYVHHLGMKCLKPFYMC